MDILDINNRDNARPLLSNIPRETRSLPSMIMFLVTSKGLLLLTLNFVMVYIYFVAAWKVCRENQKIVFKVTTPPKKKKKETKMEEPLPSPSINRIESQSTVESQPREVAIEKTNTKKATKTKEETELSEIQIPRFKYQKQPSQEIIPLPSPPSFKNKRNQKTKF